MSSVEEKRGHMEAQSRPLLGHLSHALAKPYNRLTKLRVHVSYGPDNIYMGIGMHVEATLKVCFQSTVDEIQLINSFVVYLITSIPLPVKTWLTQLV